MEKEDFTEEEVEILRSVPASAKELSNKIGCQKDHVYRKVYDIRDKIGEDKLINANGTYVWNGGDEIHRITSRNKGSVTKKANKHLTKLERDEKNKLAKLEPAIGTVPVSLDGDEDIVIPRSDSHFGQIVWDDMGKRIFDVEIALRRERKINDEVIRLGKEIMQVKNIDTCHLLLGGDSVTNENIYEDQAFNIELTLDKQIDLAADLFYNHIKKLAEIFPHVRVVCQAGNHGEIRANGTSKKANADDIAYSRVDRLVREAQTFGALQNVTVIRNDSTNYINFKIRGHNAHLRHGQDSLFHIGTSSGFDRWKTWWYKNKFDIAYRGHYHSLRIEEVLDKPVVMSGSVCPPGEYEDSLGTGNGSPGAIIHGVTDDDVMPWMRRIKFGGGTYSTV